MRRQQISGHIVLFLCFSVLQLDAQQLPNLSGLTTPSAPAFTILGIQPGEIARPKSFNALEGSLMSAFMEQNTFILPRNYSLEFTPYWFKSHPGLSFDKYVSPDIGQSLLQNLSFSLATTFVKNTTDTSNFTKMGIGLRTTIVPGKTSNQLKEIIKQSYLINLQQAKGAGFLNILENIEIDTINDIVSLRKAIDSEFNIFLKSQKDEKLINELIFFKSAEIDPFLKNKTTSGNEDIRKVAAELKNKVRDIFNREEFRDIIKKLQNTIKEKFGFMLELDAAVVLDFPTNQISYSRLPKWGIWVIPSYRLESQAFDFLGIIRYIRDETTVNSSDNIDLGARIVFQRTRFSISAEGIFRYQSILLSKETVDDVTTTMKTTDNDYRIDAGFEYKIAEKVSVNFTMGKNFKPNIEVNGDLLAILGINFGFGGPKLDVFDQH